MLYNSISLHCNLCKKSHYCYHMKFLPFSLSFQAYKYNQHTEVGACSSPNYTGVNTRDSSSIKAK